MEIRRVGVLSVGKVYGVVCALFGLIFGAVFALFYLLGVTNSQGSDALVGLVFGVGAVIFLPLFYGVLGFIFGLISALLYNGVARFIGGIEIEVEERSHSGSTYGP